MTKNIIIESIKEFFRVIVIAIIPLIISSIEKGVIDWKSIAVVGAIAGLKFLDKLLHEVGVEREIETGEISNLTTGITRF